MAQAENLPQQQTCILIRILNIEASCSLMSVPHVPMGEPDAHLYSLCKSMAAKVPRPVICTLRNID